jgi:hypothetical protein
LVQRVSVLVAAISVIFLASGWGWQELAQAAQDEKGNKSSESGDVTLRIAGHEGTRFSGVCSVGEEEHDISGRVPKSFEYDLNYRQLACEIRKQGAQDAGLKVVLKGENTRSVQWSEGGEDAIVRLVYEDGTVSSSMSSTSSQTVSIANGESLSSSAEDEAGRRGDENRGSLADQIQKKVDKILERAMP